jgi:hypothetical protein
MQTVYKYELKDAPVGKEFIIPLPEDAKPLSVFSQHGWPCMWVMHTDQTTRIVKRRFYIYGTGHVIPFLQEHLKFVGTMLMDAGNSIYHVFEVEEAL